MRGLAATLIDNYQAELQLDGRKVIAEPQDLGIKFDLSGTVNAAMAAGDEAATTVRYNPFDVKSVPLAMIVDQEKLQVFLNDTFISSEKRSTDADITYDADQQRYVVVPSEPGTQADAAGVVEALSQGQGFGSALAVPTIKEQPAITNEAAQKVADAANEQMLAKPYVIKASDKSWAIPAGTMDSWLTFTHDPENGTINRGVDEAKVAAELPGLLTESLTTIPVSTQIMMSPQGYALGTVRYGEDGTTVADPTGVVAQVIEALKAGNGLDMGVEVVHQEAGSEQVPMPDEYLQPNGARWVEVNLSNFTMTRWEGTTALSTWNVVTGRAGFPARAFPAWARMRGVC